MITDAGVDQTELCEPLVDPDTDSDPDPDWNPFFWASVSYDRCY